MSKETQKMDPAAGFDTLYTAVRAPAFFAKLAEHGVRPRDARQAERMIEIGDRLGAAERERQAKQAAAGGDFLDRIADELPGLLGQEAPAAKTASYYKAQADTLAVDPQIFEAARAVYAQARAAQNRS